MRKASAGHVAFAATMVGIGIMGLVKADFTVVWEPVSKGVPARQALVYACALVSAGCGLGLLWQRTSAAAARVLLGWLLLWMLLFGVSGLLRSLSVDVYWSACKTAVLLAAAWVLFAWFASGWDRRYLGFAIGDKGLRVARALYGVAIIPFGIAHFQYLKHTAEMVPAWLPGHLFWASITGGAFIVAGIAILVGVYARLAAALSALQMGVFFVLVWVPAIARGHMTRFAWGEAVITWVLTAAAWVVVDSYHRMPGWAAAHSK